MSTLSIFFLTLSAVVVGYLLGAFVMAYRLIKDFTVFALTGESSKRLKTLHSAIERLVKEARATADE